MRKFVCHIFIDRLFTFTNLAVSYILIYLFIAFIFRSRVSPLCHPTSIYMTIKFSVRENLQGVYVFSSRSFTALYIMTGLLSLNEYIMFIQNITVLNFVCGNK